MSSAERKPMDTNDQLTVIAYQIYQAELHRALIRTAMAKLEQAGMYPGLPTERWKDGRYLYLFFRAGADSFGLQLDAKGRLYIGADPAKIEAARRRVWNRERWEALYRAALYLDSWMRDMIRQIKILDEQARRWPRAKEELLVGPDIAAWPGAASPKEWGPTGAQDPAASSPNDDDFDNLHELDGDYGVAMANRK